MPFYVTFHGGSPSKGIPDPQPYVVSYTPAESGGWTVNQNVFNLPSPSQKYNELRDIQLCGDGNFYVANAYKNAERDLADSSIGRAKRRANDLHTGRGSPL